MDRKELDLADDLIFGATNIAKEMGLNPRQTYHMLYNGLLPPAFRIGRRWYARKSTLKQWISSIEQSSLMQQGAKHGPGDPQRL